MSPHGARRSWTLPGKAKQGPMDAQLLRLVDGAKLTPDRATSPLPKGLTLPFLLPQHSHQQVPGPSSTRDGTGTQTPLGLPPHRHHSHSFPDDDPSLNHPGMARTCWAIGRDPPGAVLPATPQPCHHRPAHQAGARHSQRLG